MNSKIRILLCDDSSVVRRIIKTALRPYPDLSVVAEATNGKEGVQLAKSIRPDVVVMDVEMPEMDGIDAVRLLRRSSFDAPIIMFSSLTSRGAEATMDAIDAGANDFATKPHNVGHIQIALKHIQDELVQAIRRWTKPALPAPSPKVQASNPIQVSSFAGKIEAIGIGISTGGPQTLSQLFAELPKSLNVPIYIVQHMPPVFTGLLAERLAKIKGHRVREATDGETVSRGDVVIAPGDFHMTTFRKGPSTVVKLDQLPRINSCRPAVDPLFESLANDFGNKCLGVIMTGMGSDGVNGAEKLKQKGAKVIVQDEQSSVIWGMPQAVFSNGFADQVLSISGIAKEITAISNAFAPGSSVKKNKHVINST